MSAYADAMARLMRGQHLPPSTARGLMDALMGAELTDAQAAACLTALQIKGVTAAELAALARGMRARMVRVPTAGLDGPLLDTCGTGGSGLDTPNTSTMSAFIVAADGVKVAKHGNRASSGRCGSSDLLAGLGVELHVGPQRARALLDTVGLAFLFAPAYHPAVKAVVPVRRQVGFRTAFNLLGPLCNPAGADHQLLGVGDPRHASDLARALLDLGSERVLVVHGDDGLDELSLCAPTRTWMVADGTVIAQRIAPEDLGLQRVAPEAIRGGDVATNVALCRRVLGGEDDGPITRLVLLNAGAALWVAGRVDDIAAGYQRAESLLRSGAARRVLEAYRAAAGEIDDAAAYGNRTLKMARDRAERFGEAKARGAVGTRGTGQ